MNEKKALQILLTYGMSLKLNINSEASLIESMHCKLGQTPPHTLTDKSIFGSHNKFNNSTLSSCFSVLISCNCPWKTLHEGSENGTFSCTFTWLATDTNDSIFLNKISQERCISVMLHHFKLSTSVISQLHS